MHEEKMMQSLSNELKRNIDLFLINANLSQEDKDKVIEFINKAHIEGNCKCKKD
jgi:hypothetical protein